MELSPQTRVLCDVVNGEEDFACVLLCTAFLDECLGSLLASRMLANSATDELLMSGAGPLGSLRNRAMTARSLGLISEETYANIDVVRRLRNEFAHAFPKGAFSEPATSELCMRLILPVAREEFAIGEQPERMKVLPWDRDARARFTYVVTVMANSLILAALGDHRPSGG